MCSWYILFVVIRNALARGNFDIYRCANNVCEGNDRILRHNFTLCVYFDRLAYATDVFYWLGY